jgi:hypothetical protein
MYLSRFAKMIFEMDEVYIFFMGTIIVIYSNYDQITSNPRPLRKLTNCNIKRTKQNLRFVYR